MSYSCRRTFKCLILAVAVTFLLPPGLPFAQQVRVKNLTVDKPSKTKPTSEKTYTINNCFLSEKSATEIGMAYSFENALHFKKTRHVDGWITLPGKTGGFPAGSLIEREVEEEIAINWSEKRPLSAGPNKYVSYTVKYYERWAHGTLLVARGWPLRDQEYDFDFLVEYSFEVIPREENCLSGSYAFLRWVPREPATPALPGVSGGELHIHEGGRAWSRVSFEELPRSPDLVCEGRVDESDTLRIDQVDFQRFTGEPTRADVKEALQGAFCGKALDTSSGSPIELSLRDGGPGYILLLMRSDTAEVHWRKVAGVGLEEAQGRTL